MLVPKNKKGDVPDLLTFLILIFIFGAGLFIMSFVVPKIAVGLESAGLNTTQEGQSAIDTVKRYGGEGIQNGFLFLFFGLSAATLISSFFVRSHPIWIFLYIVFLVLTIFVGTYLSNGYQVLVENDAFVDIINERSGINTVFQNLTNILLGVGILSILIIFGKFSSFTRVNDGGDSI